MSIKKPLLTAALFVLTCSIGIAQNNFKKIDDWLSANAPEMGGRVVLVIYQGNKVVYSAARNDLSVKQKMVNNFIARRSGKPANNADFTADTPLPLPVAANGIALRW